LITAETVLAADNSMPITASPLKKLEPLHPSSGLWVDKGRFHQVNNRENIRTARKIFDMIIADVKRCDA
jgi:hypothetical protein